MHVCVFSLVFSLRPIQNTGTSSMTATLSGSRTVSGTATASTTPSITPTPSVTPSPTSTGTHTPSNTPSSVATPTGSMTATLSATATHSNPTSSPTQTESSTETVSHTASMTATTSATASASPSPSYTPPAPIIVDVIFGTSGVTSSVTSNQTVVTLLRSGVACLAGARPTDQVYITNVTDYVNGVAGTSIFFGFNDTAGVNAGALLTPCPAPSSRLLRVLRRAGGGRALSTESLGSLTGVAITVEIAVYAAALGAGALADTAAAQLADERAHVANVTGFVNNATAAGVTTALSGFTAGAAYAAGVSPASVNTGISSVALNGVPSPAPQAGPGSSSPSSSNAGLIAG